MRDLGSRYTFSPLVKAHLAHGDEVAAHLAELFAIHGPPLFLKQDNGGNLNHWQVDELLAKAMNHRKRPCLHRRTSCAVFASGADLARAFTRRERREVYDHIKKHTIELIEKDGYDPDAAWRLAVETWLLDNRFITVCNRKGVLPGSRENRSHY
ncbi:MAG: hypothetical protein JXQ75_21360 [Phycisphaerae bacterium]|nr:hypothetical protein [Phycisphaerae bacterium]